MRVCYRRFHTCYRFVLQTLSHMLQMAIFLQSLCQTVWRANFNVDKEALNPTAAINHSQMYLPVDYQSRHYGIKFNVSTTTFLFVIRE
jgi:CRISPR/Cas system-associated protein Cas7 (RAMP superfamily)